MDKLTPQPSQVESDARCAGSLGGEAGTAFSRSLPSKQPRPPSTAAVSEEEHGEHRKRANSRRLCKWRPDRGDLTVAAYRWDPDGAPRAIVQITHGMGEHALRYAGLAQALNARGIAVYAQDHRGHVAAPDNAPVARQAGADCSARSWPTPQGHSRHNSTGADHGNGHDIHDRRGEPRRGEGRGDAAIGGLRRPAHPDRRRGRTALRAAATVEGLPAWRGRTGDDLRPPGEVVCRARCRLAPRGFGHGHRPCGTRGEPRGR